MVAPWRGCRLCTVTSRPEGGWVIISMAFTRRACTFVLTFGAGRSAACGTARLRSWPCRSPPGWLPRRRLLWVGRLLHALALPCLLQDLRVTCQGFEARCGVVSPIACCLASYVHLANGCAQSQAARMPLLLQPIFLPLCCSNFTPDLSPKSLMLHLPGLVAGIAPGHIPGLLPAALQQLPDSLPLPQARTVVSRCVTSSGFRTPVPLMSARLQTWPPPVCSWFVARGCSDGTQVNVLQGTNLRGQRCDFARRRSC